MWFRRPNTPAVSPNTSAAPLEERRPPARNAARLPAPELGTRSRRSAWAAEPQLERAGSVPPGGGEGSRKHRDTPLCLSPSPCKARPQTTFTARGTKRVRLHLRRQCLLAPCAAHSRSLGRRWRPMRVPRCGAGRRGPKALPQGRSTNRRFGMGAAAGWAPGYNQSASRSARALPKVGRNRFVRGF